MGRGCAELNCILEAVAKTISEKLNTKATVAELDPCLSLAPLAAYNTTIWCKLPEKGKAVSIRVDRNCVNDLSGLYGADGTKELHDLLVNEFLYRFEKEPKEETKQYATQINPTKHTFVGYQCSSCGAQLTVDGFKLKCTHCGQTFYQKD